VGAEILLTRSIDADPFGPTFEENFFRKGKRICVGLAIVAVGIGTFDLMNARPVAATAVRETRLHYTEIPGRLLTAIRQISIAPNQTDVSVANLRDATIKAPKIAAASTETPAAPIRLAMAPQTEPQTEPQTAPQPAPMNAVSKSEVSPVAELAAARHTDAVEFAMASPATMDDFKKVSLTSTDSMPALESAASAVMRRGESIKLASISPSPVPDELSNPEPVPATSLPMSAAIPLAMVPLPTPAPGVPPLSPAQRLKLEGKEYAKAERCLANAIYFEARSEPIRGQMAVAQVVVNRAFSGFYPNDICGVVYQNANRHLSCQFTFACDGKRKAITERGHWARANRIAKQTLDGQIYVPEVAKSTHYHAVYVHPNWVHEMKKMVRFGVHNFYRPYAWGNGAEEPVWGSPALLAEKNEKKK